jgi:hypothetical protein
LNGLAPIEPFSEGLSDAIIESLGILFLLVLLHHLLKTTPKMLVAGVVISAVIGGLADAPWLVGVFTGALYGLALAVVVWWPGVLAAVVALYVIAVVDMGAPFLATHRAGYLGAGLVSLAWLLLPAVVYLVGRYQSRTLQPALRS